MRKAWAVSAVAGAVVGMLLIIYLLGGFVQDPSGFREGDLNAPLINEFVRDEDYPGPLSGSSYPMNVQPSISYGTTVSVIFGGVLELFVENEGSNDVYVHHYYATWEGEAERFQVNSSLLIPSGDRQGLGILRFAGPGVIGPATLEVHVEIWTSSASGIWWDDKGELVATTIDFVAVAEESLRDRVVERNPLRYYDKVNGLIDLDAVSSFATEVGTSIPGNFSLAQVIEAYELVSSRINYTLDEDDHWQSPAETLSLGSGDCEDHSLLLASLITALGGTCRVNLISGHAFPTVYVGNSSVIDKVVGAVQAYYGNPVPVFYTVDEMGCWLVIDTNGLPYVGGHPAASSPVGAAGGVSWNFDDGDWIKLIDVTGETAGGLF